MRTIPNKNMGYSLSLLNRIENNFPVHTWRTSQYRIWPLIRHFLHAHFYNQHSNLYHIDGIEIKKIVDDRIAVSTALIESKRIRINTLKNKLSSMINLRGGRVPSVREINDADVLIISSARNLIEINGYHFDTTCESIVINLEMRGLNSAVLQLNGNGLVPRFFTRRGLHDITESLNNYQKSNWLSNNITLSPDFATSYEDMLLFIVEQTGDNTLLWRCGTPRVIYEIKKNQAYVNYYTRLLKNTRASTCFISGYSSFKVYPLCIACSLLEIKTIDIQHGVMSSVHPAYSRWNNVPSSGYEILPNTFWVWSESEAQVINEWAIRQETPHRAVTVGNQWLKMQFTDEHPIINSKLINLLDTIINPNMNSVLLTLQPLGGLERSLPDYIIKEMQRTRYSWKWFIRLHPGMRLQVDIWKKFLELHCSDACYELDCSSSMPLHTLLRYMDLHVTQSSSVILDANLIGVPSIITDKFEYIHFQDKISSDFLILSESLSVGLNDLYNNTHSSVSKNFSNHGINERFLSEMELIAKKSDAVQ